MTKPGTMSLLAAAVAAVMATTSMAAADDLPPGTSGEADFRMYCADCHGDGGKGDGPKSFGLSIPPPDLTELTARYNGTFPRDYLMRVIDGRDPLKGHLDREMPVWGKWFKMEAEDGLGGAEGDEGSVDRRINNLIDFLETLQNKE